MGIRIRDISSEIFLWLEEQEVSNKEQVTCEHPSFSFIM